MLLLAAAAAADAAADNYLLAAACWLLPIMKYIIFAVVAVAAVVAVVAVVALVAVVAVVTVFAVVAPKTTTEAMAFQRCCCVNVLLGCATSQIAFYRHFPTAPGPAPTQHLL